MTTELVRKEDINTVLGERFDPASSTIYKSVIVLLLYWKDADGDYKSEADQLERLFKQKYNYTVLRFEIPSKDSNLALHDEISRVRRQFSTPRSLTIIHYGGHGDRDDERSEGEAYPPKKSVWAAKRQITDDKVLNWSYIQPQLGLGKGDFLVILDCCFGAQAARAPESQIIPPNVELLAAAPMGCSTPGPGPFSFTHAFINEVEDALARQGHADISEIHHRLAAGDRKLIQTPTHFCHGRQSTIRLEPHSPARKTSPVRDTETRLMMQMLVDSPLDHHLLDRIVRWLVNFVPHEVSGLQVTELVHRAAAAQHFILQESSGSRSVLKLDTLPQPSKTEVRSAWATFNWSLRDSLRWLPNFGAPAEDFNLVDIPSEQYAADISEETRIRQFLQSFDANIVLLESVIERNVFAVPELLEEIHLADAIRDPTSKDLGLVKSLQVRLENLRFEEKLQNLSSRNEYFLEFRTDSKLPSAGSLTCEQHPKFGRVLVEYSHYARTDKETQRRNDARMDHLVKILSGSNLGFNTPACLGWTAVPSNFRYALLFQNPHGDTHCPITLYDIMGPPGGGGRAVARPTLGQRFEIAQTIGQTLLKWHDVGWVHESISSLNVIFSLDRTTLTVDYSKLYLCGFSFSRLTSRHSTPRHGEDDIVRDVYQHPERQGNSPEQRHTKEHDLYSFGVLLFEIGFWGRAPDFFSKLVQRAEIGLIRGKMLNRIEHLGREMGTAYASATQLCLSQDFGIDVDDKVQSRLARKFEHQVLRKLDAGTRLDS